MLFIDIGKIREYNFRITDHVIDRFCERFPERIDDFPTINESIQYMVRNISKVEIRYNDKKGVVQLINTDENYSLAANLYGKVIISITKPIDKKHVINLKPGDGVLQYYDKLRLNTFSHRDVKAFLDILPDLRMGKIMELESELGECVEEEDKERLIGLIASHEGEDFDRYLLYLENILKHSK